LTDFPDLEEAVVTAAAQITSRLKRDPPDLVFAFVSAHHRKKWALLPSLVHDALPSALLLGCSAGGVIGDGREVEDGPALSLTAARLPGVELRSFHLDEQVALTEPAALRVQMGIDDDTDPHVIVLPDPFTCDAPALVAALDPALPRGTKIGGLASGGARAGENILFCGPSAVNRGAVGITMRGNLEMETVVAQGCRPIGSPLFVTRKRDNLILELDGRVPAEVIQELFMTLSESDRKLARHALFIGLAMATDREAYGQGDFLIRNLIGLDPATGGIGVGATIQEKMVVHFHLRDAATSAEDLEQLLAAHTAQPNRRKPDGALLFSCLGRGSGLYGQPNHDTDAVAEHLGRFPIGGFFCNGEIGPVYGSTFVHGYTSALALFSAPPTQ
jgi:small ligand-binding sensory domain FIST